jgi:hypothetical protein
MKYLIWFVVVLVLALLVNYTFDDAAMAQCQITHSYDVCFQQLNR